MQSQVSFSVRLNRILEHVFSNVLMPYQTKAVCDPAPFKIFNKARQIGFSEFVLAFGGWLDVFRGEPVYFVSRTQDQSTYLMDKFYKWGKFFAACGLPLKFEYESKTEAKIFGVDVKALSSNAAGDEGYTGHVKLDEFALFEDDRRIYDAIVPTIGTGFTLTICSRPLGQSNLHYDIFTNKDKYPTFSRHEVSIYDAVEQGFKVDIEQIANLFGGTTSDSFRELYCCEFIDESTAFLSYELLRDCIGEKAKQIGDLYLGVDIGRKKDLTVCYLLNKLGDKKYTELIEVMEKTAYNTQERFIVDLVKTRKVRGGGVDDGGIGSQLAENVKRSCYQIEPVRFTNQSKEEMAYGLRSAFESHAIQIPDDPVLINDLHSIKKTVTRANNVRFDAERSDEGHADRFWALAIANQSTNHKDGPSLTWL